MRDTRLMKKQRHGRPKKRTQELAKIRSQRKPREGKKMMKVMQNAMQKEVKLKRRRSQAARDRFEEEEEGQGESCE